MISFWLDGKKSGISVCALRALRGYWRLTGAKASKLGHKTFEKSWLTEITEMDAFFLTAPPKGARGAVRKAQLAVTQIPLWSGTASTRLLRASPRQELQFVLQRWAEQKLIALLLSLAYHFNRNFWNLRGSIELWRPLLLRSQIVVFGDKQTI